MKKFKTFIGLFVSVLIGFLVSLWITKDSVGNNEPLIRIASFYGIAILMCVLGIYLSEVMSDVFSHENISLSLILLVGWQAYTGYAKEGYMIFTANYWAFSAINTGIIILLGTFIGGSLLRRYVPTKKDGT